MSLLLFFVLTISLLASAASQIVNATLHGTIVSAQITCTAPCAENEALTISRTNYVNQLNVQNNVILQELLPPAPSAVRSFETYTAYDEKSRSFLVVAAEYPRIDSATFWVSTLNNDVTVAKPVHVEVTIDYPVSSSPFPLSVVHLKISRVFFGLNGIFVSFSNGEIHSLDLSGKVLKKLTSIIPETEILSNSYPRSSWSQVYDSDSNSVWHVITQGSNAFVTKLNLADLTTTEWVALKQPQGIHEDFAPDTFLNAHMLKFDENEPARLAITIESLDDVGFDEILFVDTTTGQLSNICANLMEYNVVLQCSNPLECDKKRVSTFDPIDKKIYFQGHAVGSDGSTSLTMFYVYFFTSHITGKLETTVAPAFSAIYGYSGFQFVLFA